MRSQPFGRFQCVDHQAKVEGRGIGIGDAAAAVARIKGGFQLGQTPRRQEAEMAVIPPEGQDFVPQKSQGQQPPGRVARSIAGDDEAERADEVRGIRVCSSHRSRHASNTSRHCRYLRYRRPP